MAVSRDLAGWFIRRAGVARFTTLFCAAGLAAAALVGPHPVLAALALAGALLALLAGLALGAPHSRTRMVSRLLVLVSVLVIGFSCGLLGGSARVLTLDGGAASQHFGARLTGKLVVTGAVRSHAGWQSANARVVAAEAVFIDGHGQMVSVMLPQSETVLLEVAPPTEGTAAIVPAALLEEGAYVVCKGTLEEPDGPTASGFDQKAHLRRQGIEVVLRVRAGDVVKVGSRGGFSGWFDRVRARARSDLSRGPDARLDEVLQGVVMGDTQGLDESWVDAFRRAGTAHMLSVSGLHVGSLAAIMLAIARLLRLSRGLGFLLAALAALSMIPFAGPSPPVIRSAVMIIIVLSGRWLGRGRDQWQVLGMAGVAVLAPNPYAILDAGFQLSFGAFAGMVAMTVPLQKRLSRLPSAVSSNLAVSIAASLGTAPISLATFGQTSLVGAIANLLVIPILTVITGLGMASVVLGRVWSGFSTLLDTLAAPASAWTVQVSRLFAAAPVLETDDLGRAVAACLAAMLVLPAVLALNGRLPRAPWGIPLPYFRRCMRWMRARAARSSSLSRVAAVGLVVVALVGGLMVYGPVAAGGRSVAAALAGHWPQQLEVRILDVGQGNAVLVRTPEHQALLFDGGPEGCDLERQLIALGVRKLDVVVVSHPHADHFAGLSECAGSVDVDLFVDATQVIADPQAQADATSAGGDPPSSGREGRQYLQLRRLLLAEGARYMEARTGTSLEVDGLTVDFYAPRVPLLMVDGADPWRRRGEAPSGEELNASSVVALLRYGDTEVLLPGDAEAEVLARYALAAADVVMVPHHGSKGAVTEDLLRGLGTKSAPVSVGADNSFGHPDQATLALLQQRVATIPRTDLVGWVSYTTDGREIVMATER